jgi:hypothetical protein
LTEVQLSTIGKFTALAAMALICWTSAPAFAASATACDRYADNYASRYADRGQMLGGAAKGSLLGAGIGAIFGGAGAGAAIGAGLGVIRGGNRQASEYGRLYDLAFRDCMSGSIR